MSYYLPVIVVLGGLILLNNFAPSWAWSILILLIVSFVIFRGNELLSLIGGNKT